MGHDHLGHDHSGHGHAHGHAGHEHAAHDPVGRDHFAQDHGHSHAPKDFGFAFAMASGLNVALIVAQVVYGIAANSIALLADAGHNFGDVLGLLLAWAAHVAMRRAPTPRYTYGLRPASILSALLNAMLVLVAAGAIAWEAIRRLPDPGEVAGVTVMVVAGLGILVNGGSAWLLMAGRKDDLNIHGAFVHLLTDAAVSVGVVVAGGAILLTGMTWIDPAVSLIVCVVIVWGTWGLMRESIKLALGAVPGGIDPAAVRAHLEELAGVTSIHDLHIWAMSTTENALTAHLVMPSGHPGDAFLAAACHGLDHRFGIRHATLQIETADAGVCALAPEHVV